MARIAFFTLNAYDMLTGGYRGSAVGGAQLQQILIGKELARRGHDVFFVEYDSERKEEECIDGIKVITKARPCGTEVSRGITVLQGTKYVLDRIEPNVCYRRSLDFEIFPLSVYCSLTNTRFVYGIAHDDELTNNPHKLSTGLKKTAPYKRMNKWALSNASAVIAQNLTQYNLASDRLGTEVYQIPNCYEPEMAEPIDWDFDSPVVFWAGRLTSWKQPELVAELAESLPEINFVMAGGPGDKNLASKVQKRADEQENLAYVGHVPFSAIDRYFAAADIFLNTSKNEGFPNTFLQAWANETPVVSLQVDPNEILSSKGIGINAEGSISKLRDRIYKLSTNPSRIEKLGKASRSYLSENHSVEIVSNMYEIVFCGKND